MGFLFLKVLWTGLWRSLLPSTDKTKPTINTATTAPVGSENRGNYSMAGDWIKMTHSLPDKPEVLAISQRLGISRFETVGRLHSIWRWFDTQTDSGHANSVTSVTLAACLFGDKVGTEFVDSLKSVGWLVEDSCGTSIPNFDYHISESAKTRAQSSNRKQKQREKSVTEMSRSHRDKSVTREEKRIEENINTTTDVVVVASNELATPKDDTDKFPACPHDEIIRLYSEILPELPAVRIWDGARAANLRGRWVWVMKDIKKKGKEVSVEAGIDFFNRMFGYISDSDFLTGRDGKWSGCNLAWIVKASNFAKIIEGHYEGKVSQ